MYISGLDTDNVNLKSMKQLLRVKLWAMNIQWRCIAGEEWGLGSSEWKESYYKPMP